PAMQAQAAAAAVSPSPGSSSNLSQSWKITSSTDTHRAEPFRVIMSTRPSAATANGRAAPASRAAPSNAPATMEHADELRKFRALPPNIQKSLFSYEDKISALLLNYASSGSATRSIESLMWEAPEYLLTVDNQTYRDSPLGRALLKKNQHASRFFIELASSGPQKKFVLSHRNSAAHTLLMLAIDFDSANCRDILINLLQSFPTQIYQFYDTHGRNVFHCCAVDKYATSFRIILDAVLEMDSMEISKHSIKEALDMTDRFYKTPIHYMAEAGDIEMFNVLDSFARSKALQVDYDARFLTSDSKTPLMIAVESCRYDACKWLLEKGSADVSAKQPVSCFTALHFAVKQGSYDLIGLLRSHGADAEFYDEDCERLEGYKTPLQIAKTEVIPNKNKCIEYLTLNPSALACSYNYTVDSMPRAVPAQTPALPASAASASGNAASASSSSSLPHPAIPQQQQQCDPAEFFRDKKIVKDLQLFGTERREELSKQLGKKAKSEQFVSRLIQYAPDLKADEGYIHSEPDPVFLAISLLSDSDHASRCVIKQVLLDIEAGELVELVIPATTS
ncbi:hypothetical protein BOX15_Mlig001172g14, partial [Macrostomum lignano]